MSAAAEAHYVRGGLCRYMRLDNVVAAFSDEFV